MNLDVANVLCLMSKFFFFCFLFFVALSGQQKIRIVA